MQRPRIFTSCLRCLYSSQVSSFVVSMPATALVECVCVYEVVLLPLPFPLLFSISLLRQLSFLSAGERLLLTKQSPQHGLLAAECAVNSGGEHIRHDLNWFKVLALPHLGGSYSFCSVDFVLAMTKAYQTSLRSPKMLSAVARKKFYLAISWWI